MRPAGQCLLRKSREMMARPPSQSHPSVNALVTDATSFIWLIKAFAHSFKNESKPSPRHTDSKPAEKNWQRDWEGIISSDLRDINFDKVISEHVLDVTTDYGANRQRKKKYTPACHAHILLPTCQVIPADLQRSFVAGCFSCLPIWSGQFIMILRFILSMNGWHNHPSFCFEGAWH